MHLCLRAGKGMKVLLYIVVEGNEGDVEEIQNQLKHHIQNISFSPFRIQESLNECIEFYATFSVNLDQIEPLLAWLDNDWDGEEDDCICYGFNTKPFNSKIYYMHFEYEKSRNH